MATFKRKVMTQKRKKLLSRALARDTQIIFTRVETTDFIYTDIIDVSKIIQLDNPKQSVNVSNIIRNNNKVTVHSVFTNEGLINSYTVNGIGIYAKDSNNDEILFSVLVAQNGDVMASQQGQTVTNLTFDFVFIISDTTNVKIEVDNNATATVSMLNSEKENIKNNYVKNIDYATEEKHGIAKIYSESEAETDSEKIKNIVEVGNGEEREFLREDSSGAVYGDSYWDKVIKILDHTKILTVKGLVKILRKIIKPATENEYGLTNNSNIKSMITTYAPKPNLTPYVPFSKGFRNQNDTDWFVRTNGRITWASDVFEMWNGDNNQFMGAFHTNSYNSFYKVPNRNGGNWNRILDEHDFNNLNTTVNQIVGSYVRDLRMSGYVVGIIYHHNVGIERNGYVVTGVVQNTNDNIVDLIQMRALQVNRGGNWYNVPFA